MNLLLFLTIACSPEPRELPAPELRLGNYQVSEPRISVRGEWGIDFGLDPAEPLGPAAVLRDGDGFAILDQENLRILRYTPEGLLLGSVEIPSRATMDTVRDETGFSLLSWRREPTPGWWIEQVDLQGKLRMELELPADMDAPSGIFTLQTGIPPRESILLEQAHEWLLDPFSRIRYPGRPDGGGLFVSAVKEASDRLVVTWQSLDGIDKRPVVIRTDRTLSSVVSLDPFTRPDREPAAVLTLLLYDEGPAPHFDMLDPELRVVVVDRLGHPLGEQRLAVGSATDMTRPLALGVGGHLYRLRTDERSLEVHRMELGL